MRDSCYLSSEKMPFLPWERRIALNLSIQFSSKEILDQPCSFEVFWFRVWQLNPVLKNMICHPVNESVHSFTSLLLEVVRLIFLWNIEYSFCNPIVSLASVDLTPEPELRSSREQSQSPNALRELESVIFSKRDASPFEDTSLLNNVRNDKSIGVLSQKVFLLLW